VTTPKALTRARKAADRAARLFPVRVGLLFMETGGGNQAVLIAWNSLASVLPIGLILAAVVGLVLNKLGITAATVIQSTSAYLPTDLGTRQALIQGVESLKSQTGLFALLALVGFVWTASGLFGAMEQAFSEVFCVPIRSFVRQKLMSLVMMALFIVLALVAVGTSALLPLLNTIPGLPISLTDGEAGFLMQVAIGVVAGFILFFAIYLVVPNRHQRPTRVFPAALFSGVAFEILTLVWPIYIRFNQVGLNRFGSQFALLFILLTFFYLLGLITVVGVDINAVLDPPRPAPEPQPEPQPKPMGRFRRIALGATGLLIGVAAGRRSRA